MTDSKPRLNKRGTRTGMTEASIKAAKANAVKPGEVRNPNGRTKGTRNFKTVIAEIVDFVVQATELGDDYRDLAPLLENQMGRKPTRREMMAYIMVVKAMKGDAYAFNSVCDREEGKPKQSVEIDADVEHSGEIKVKPVDISERVKQLKGEK